ncbi:MAG: hypothetical protein PHQ26_10165 [Bacteroidales bacterium]|nr:hypothetical protein [Bacteroidales bacterium]
MKTNSKLMIGFAIVAALIVGFLIGLFVEYPKVDPDQLSGTIGRVSNYRNAKATEADIELKNDLLTDTLLQKNLQAYLGFYYTKSLEFAKNITYAIDEANQEKAFATQHVHQLEAMQQYAAFLQTSRKDLLMAILLSQSLDQSTPELLRNAIAQGNNVIAQMNHRNSSVVDFIERLEAYLLNTDGRSNGGLNRAHDLLVYNQISASIVTKDKVMLKYLDKKPLFEKNIQNTMTDVQACMSSDLDEMKGLLASDSETLGLWDAEVLGNRAGGFDAEKLSSFWDVEKLGIGFYDVENLGGVTALDAEKLGAMYFDAEKLGTGFTDAEALGAGFTDTEKLGALMRIF